MGPFTENFERAFGKLLGIREVVAVNSGTSALEIILRCIGVKGRTVIVPTNTFVATPAAAIHAGASVMFADTDSHLMLSRQDLEGLLDDNVGAVVIVHIGGFVHPEVNEIRRLCEDRNLPLVEDAAHAHGSRLGELLAGTFGVASAFSFYPTKLLTTGEGGAIATNDLELAEKARVLRDQGKAGFDRNYHVALGHNWRMGELNAALGLRQLNALPRFIHHRQSIAAVYDASLSDLNLGQPMEVPRQSLPNYYKYVFFLRDGVNRAQLKARLKVEFDVALSGEVYEMPCHLQPVFQNLGIGGHRKLADSERLCAQHICLPIFSDMTAEEQQHVVHALQEMKA